MNPHFVQQRFNMIPSQFSILNANIFLGVAYISDKWTPIALAVGWLFIAIYAHRLEKKALK